jgi:hypothetical protein
LKGAGSGLSFCVKERVRSADWLSVSLHSSNVPAAPDETRRHDVAETAASFFR